MAALTASMLRRLDDDAAARPVAEIAGYLQEHIGRRVAAAVAGLVDARQIGRYACGTASPRSVTERRLREGYKAVRLLVEAHDHQTARAWLFGTNVRLDVWAPIDALASACETSEFVAVAEAARAVAASRPEPFGSLDPFGVRSPASNKSRTDRPRPGLRRPVRPAQRVI